MPCVHFYGRNFEVPSIKPDQTLKQYFGGDIQKSSEKLPGFIWAKYPNEKHLPGYNYLGPGTRLDIRLDANDIPKPDERPINEVDKLAYIHDLAYQNSNDIQDRHQADLDMIEGLKKLHNLSIPQKLIRALIIKLFKAKIKLGQGTLPPRKSKQKAYEFLKEVTDDLKSTTKQVQPTDIPEDQSINTPESKRELLADELHKPYRKPNFYRKAHFRSKDNIWNADLVKPAKLPDSGCKYILTVLDGYTRYAWAVPLKTKEGLEVANAFKAIMNQSKRKPNKLWVDQGKEFYNEHMYKLFRFKKEDVLQKNIDGEYKNQIYSVFNFSKNPVIERFNRTLMNMLSKQFTIQGNQKWVAILPELVNRYNNKRHSALGVSPTQASNDPSSIKLMTLTHTSNKPPKFKVGDRVRIFRYKYKFDKGYKASWTDEIFRVSEVRHSVPITYTIKDLQGEPILGSFYENQLQKTYF